MMKKLFFIYASLLASCSKVEEVTPDTSTVTPPKVNPPAVVDPPKVETVIVDMIDYSKQTKVVTAGFTDASHPTSGTATIYEDSKGVRTLVFTGFKTDAGPDLRILLASDLKASSAIELSKKVENGDKAYVIPKEVDLKKSNNVLIWCKQFSVLFGSATFK